MKLLKHYREESGLSQKALADIVGISRFSIMDYESGRKSPTLDTARKIANALGKSLDMLDGLEPPTESPSRRGRAKGTQAA